MEDEGNKFTMSKLDNIDLKLAEVLDGVNQALQRLVSLEERSQWHQQGLGQLKDELKENTRRVSDLERAAVKTELLERDIIHTVQRLNEAQKDLEVLKEIVSELDKASAKHEGFLTDQKTVVMAFLLSLASSLGTLAWNIFK